MSLQKRILIIALLLLAVLCVPLILICFAFIADPQYDMSFYGGMGIKYDRIKNIDGKKIVVVGGSSVAFGLRSDIMELETGMPVVNFGLYANLGTKYMLDVAEDYINDGDIVIIAPEQNNQALSLYYNAEAVWYSIDGKFEILNNINKENYGDMAREFLKFTSGKFKYWQSGNKPSPEGVYNVKSFNAFGDIEFVREYNIMNNGYDEHTPISFKKNVIDDSFIDYINAYAENLSKKGASVYYTFSPMNRLASVSDAEDSNDYYIYLTEKLNFAIIGNPETHLLESGWFYDSNFHLNESGAIYYTALLAQELKAENNDFTPIKTKVPEIPQKPKDDNDNIGNISDDLIQAAKIFELSGVSIKTENEQVILNGEWIVSGLTEYGKTLDTVTIPSTLAGLPVIKIASECFQNNSVLEEIVLGENISVIENGAFSGCSKLRAIYLTSENPTVLSPPADFLDGLDDCYIYVPQIAYNDYLFDYFWSYLSSRIVGY